MKILIDDEAGTQFARATNYGARPVTKSELRKKHRERALERVEKSAGLATVYPRLKTLTVDLLYFDRDIVSWGHGLRYRANMETAKSMLHFDCPSSLCKGGGFDLSRDLGSAVAGRLKSVVGAVHCRGSRDQETGKTLRCESLLHFKMSLAFKNVATAKRRARSSSKVRP